MVSEEITMAFLPYILSIQDLAEKLGEISTEVSIISIALSGLAYGIGSALHGAPLPFRELKQFGGEMRTDAIKAIFWLSMFGVISSAVTNVVSIIALAAK